MTTTEPNNTAACACPPDLVARVMDTDSIVRALSDHISAELSDISAAITTPGVDDSLRADCVKPSLASLWPREESSDGRHHHRDALTGAPDAWLTQHVERISSPPHHDVEALVAAVVFLMARSFEEEQFVVRNIQCPPARSSGVVQLAEAVASAPTETLANVIRAVCVWFRGAAGAGELQPWLEEVLGIDDDEESTTTPNDGGDDADNNQDADDNVTEDESEEE